MSAPAPKRENLLLNLAFNIAIPTLILTKFSGEKTLGPVWGLVVALLFPVGYGVWDFAQRKHANFISIIGFVSVLLSGSLGLLKADGFWFAVKDAAMPCVIGLGVLLSLKSSRPLIKSIVYNDQVIDLQRVDAAIGERRAEAALEALLARASYLLAGSFFVSAAINFAVARMIIVSPPGTEAFNAELGKMHTWGAAIMIVPAMGMLMLVFWKLLTGLQALTGLSHDEILAGSQPAKSPQA